MLEFDAETTRLLDSVYQGADVTRRRQGSFDALRPSPGETILDVGCGNGLLTLELARAVGADGRIIGVDPSGDMRQSAQQRCQDQSCVEFAAGSADSLPISSSTIDKAVSVQVFEYLDDIPSALSEIHRVLKPGGLLVISDIHFDSLIWHSDAPDRMERMVKAWDHHFAERRVPALLPPLLREAGFTVETVTPITICDTQLKPDGLASMMIILMRGFAEAKNLVSAEEAKNWAEEQRLLADSGCFFFSITQFVVTARKAV